MRVIAGLAKGRRLKTPQGMRIRPTSDRVREALFSMIGADSVQESVWLDLFAGTGAVGIEALSRGADRAIFVDNCRESLRLVAENLARCGFASRAQLLKMDAEAAVAFLAGRAYRFDFIYVDPPYGQGLALRLADSDTMAGLLNRGGLAIYETSRREDLAGRLDLLRQKVYGDTRIWFFLKM